jgi:hypothetical protein
MAVSSRAQDVRLADEFFADQKGLAGPAPEFGPKKHTSSKSSPLLAIGQIASQRIGAAILSVANASCLAANTAVARFVAAAEEALSEKINHILTLVVPAERIAREFAVRGKSGGERRFDFAIRDRDDFGLLINGVSAHHTSIAAKFVSFSDVESPLGAKFAVHDRPLETEDTALMQQVASVVPLARLREGATRALPDTIFFRS